MVVSFRYQYARHLVGHVPREAPSDDAGVSLENIPNYNPSISSFSSSPQSLFLGSRYSKLPQHSAPTPDTLPERYTLAELLHSGLV